MVRRLLGLIESRYHRIRDVEIAHFLDLLLGAGLAVLGWVGRITYTEIEMLKREMAEHKVQMERDFIRASRFESAITEINRKLDVVIDRLATKADRE